MSYSIITDGTCNLPQEIIDKYNIHVVPLYVIWGTESLKDGVDITSEEFFNRLETDPVHPTTSQPTPKDFAEAYKAAIEKDGTDRVLGIILSKDVSGTWNSAIQALKMTDVDVTLVDTRTASLAHGFLAQRAAENREKGMSLEDNAKDIEGAVDKVEINFTVATLEYLEKGGRIGKASRFIGDTLKLKPILYANDGEVTPKARVRTAKRALNKLVDVFNEETEGKTIKQWGIIHANAPEDVEKLKKAMKHVGKEPTVITISPVVGVHAGPGMYGIAWELE